MEVVSKGKDICNIYIYILLYSIILCYFTLYDVICYYNILYDTILYYIYYILYIL